MHQPLGGVQGQATDIAIQAEQMAYTKRLLQERIAQHTGQTYETIEADLDRDRWFTAEQAKEYGLIDHVIVKRGDALISACADKCDGSAPAPTGPQTSRVRRCRFGGVSRTRRC